MDRDLNISVLVAARDEYIDHLRTILTPMLEQGFNSIYEDALKISEGKRVLYTFQKLLKDIITWNQTILQEEARRIKNRCSYIMDIVTAIFVSNVKILASIRLHGKNDNIQVKIPSSEIFIHSIYVEAAQDIFYNPYLFNKRGITLNEMQRNKIEIRTIIADAIEKAIHQEMPFDRILEEYLKGALDFGADHAPEDDIDLQPAIPPDPKNTLQMGNIVNDLVEEEHDEPPEPPGEVKNFNIDLPSKFSNLFGSNPEKPPEQPAPLPAYENPQINQQQDNGSDDEYSSDEYGSGSDYGSVSSVSSGSSGSSSSSGSSRRSKYRRDEHHRGNEHRRDEHHRGKNKHSFF